MVGCTLKSRGGGRVLPPPNETLASTVDMGF